MCSRKGAKQKVQMRGKGKGEETLKRNRPKGRARQGRAGQGSHEQSTWAMSRTPSGFKSMGPCSTFSIHSRKSAWSKGVWSSREHSVW